MHYNDTINVIITANKCIYLYPSAKFICKNAKNPSAQHVFKKGLKKFENKILFFWNPDTKMFCSCFCN